MASRCPFMIFLYLLLNFWCQLVTSVQLIFNGTTFNPTYLHGLKEGSKRTIHAQISYGLDEINKEIYDDVTLNLKLFSADPYLTQVVEGAEQNITCDHQLKTDSTSSIVCVSNISFTIEGLFLGKTSIQSVLSNRSGHKVSRLPMFDVWVVRDATLKTGLFVGTLTILIILATVGMGCELNLDMVKDVIKKPMAPLLGLSCQFILMPLIAFAIAQLLFRPVGLVYLSLGIFTAGCSPSGGASNVWTILLEGNLDLSITMTFFSTVGAFVVMPTWMFTLGRYFISDIPDTHIHVPYRNIFVSVALLVVPLLVGVAIRRYKKNLAERIRKWLRPFLILIIIFIVTFGVYASWYMFFVINWRILLAGMMLPWTGFFCGLILSLCARQEWQNTIAISIETGVQNAGIAIVLLQISFGQPDADLAAVAPVTMSMFTPFPLLTAYAIQSIRKCLNKKPKNPIEDGQKVNENSEEIQQKETLMKAKNGAIEQL